MYHLKMPNSKIGGGFEIYIKYMVIYINYPKARGYNNKYPKNLAIYTHIQHEAYQPLYKI